jgi:hypothetical protein
MAEVKTEKIDLFGESYSPEEIVTSNVVWRMVDGIEQAFVTVTDRADRRIDEEYGTSIFKLNARLIIAQAKAAWLNR